MNVSKKLAEARYHRFKVDYQKRLFQSKLEAMRPQNWDLDTVAKSADLIEAGNGSFPKEWVALYEEDKPFSLSSLRLNTMTDAIASKALNIRSSRAYQQRKGIWEKVFDFLPEEQVPSPAGKEYVIFDYDRSGEKSQKPVLGIATFGYPFVSGMPNAGDEYYYANYATYDSVIDTIRERMGLSDVYVEPVGDFTKDGKEITGTIGTLGFRVWWSPSLFSSDSLFDDDSPWLSSLKIKTNMISKLRKIDGLGYANNDRRLTRSTNACGGVFRIITVASESTTAQDYMAKADEIRRALNVPGLIIAPFGPLNDKDLLEGGFSTEADENGIHHTAFIFYVGDESKVVVNHVDTYEDGTPIAALSGFMPIHSAKRLLSSWGWSAEPAQAATSCCGVSY